MIIVVMVEVDEINNNNQTFWLAVKASRAGGIKQTEKLRR
jgi:hypothetical protein